MIHHVKLGTAVNVIKDLAKIFSTFCFNILIGM